jgi:transposase-like protein
VIGKKLGQVHRPSGVQFPELLRLEGLEGRGRRSTATADQVAGMARRDLAISKIIYTTNAIESLNRIICKSIKTRGSFSTKDVALKLIYVAIRQFEKGGRNIRKWYAARNQFIIMFDDRFNA